MLRIEENEYPRVPTGRKEFFMSTEENKALVRRYYEEVLTKRNPELVDELFSPD